MSLTVVSYGGGVNSVAVLIRLHRLGVVPRAIVMADPGSERAGTIHFRDNILPAWLDRVGFPRVEWEELRRDEPGKFQEAVDMSRNAEVTSPDVVGLMRCNPHGLRQLHVWAEDGYQGRGRGGREDAMPCECAL